MRCREPRRLLPRCSALLVPRKTPQPGRYKIWELEAGTHCSVIGTCLSLEDLHRLIRKANATIAPDADDHDIHGYFVIQAARRSVVSKLIHKALDRKYAPQIARFRSGTPDELWALWKQAMTNGDVAGAYWALMRRRRCRGRCASAHTTRFTCCRT